MMMARGKYTNCLNCQFYDGDSEGNAICVRYPPIMVEGKHSQFPYTYDLTYCGEFKEWPDIPDDFGEFPPFSDKDLAAYMEAR